jgi:hypothetical protein
VQQRLDDLVRLQADVEGCVDVDVELRLAAAQGRQHAQGDQLAVPRGQLRAVVQLAECPGNHLVSQLGGDVGQ